MIVSVGVLGLPIEPVRAVGVAQLSKLRMCRGGCAYGPKFDGFSY